MTPEAQRIAIAEACGWKCIHESRPANYVALYDPSGNLISMDEDPDTRMASFSYLLPDYLSDLNAMHEAEKMLTDEEYHQFSRLLYDIWCRENSRMKFGSGVEERSQSSAAALRAEAFICAIGKGTTPPP